MALRRADPSSKKSYRLCEKDYGTEEEAREKQKAVEPVMNEYTYILCVCVCAVRSM
jgi:hypothetical protein